MAKLVFPEPLPAAKSGPSWVVEADGVEVRLSNLNKVWWPDEGYTKGDLLTAYYNLAPWILPHLRDRPLTMRRMPDGSTGPEFYQKEIPDHAPRWVPRTHVTGRGANEKGGTTFVLAQDVASLLFVANLGCIEFHPWHSRYPAISFPDYAFFDLDPFPPITYERVRRTALLVKVALEKLGLRGYPKTSGATGMQIFVPLDGSHTYEESRGFVERVSRLINQTWPDGTTMEWEIAKRSGKVFLDHGMNTEGKNIASVYSVRPFPGASLSTPLTWNEVEEDIEPGDFTIGNIWERLERTGDLFNPVLAGGSADGQNLSEAMEALGAPFNSAKKPLTAARAVQGEAPEEPSDETLLREYKRKRRFDVTPEPAGEVVPPGETLTFMIHKHHARRLHYDLRLERNGVLASWAVPKGLPEEPGIRHLAVHVEDHPMEYGKFEGSIPKGEYGAGEVRIFDRGTYEAPEWTDKKITIRLHGERLQGEYHLVNTRDKDWLIFRSRTSPPQFTGAAPPVVEPMMATGGAQPFDSKDWVFEVKWDGVRTLALIDHDKVKLLSRRVRDVTAQYPELEKIASQLSGFNGLLDGEIVSLDDRGRPSFERLQQRSATSKPGQALVQSHPIEYVVFDLLWLDGESLMSKPLEERFGIMQRVVVPGQHVQLATRIPQKGKRFFEEAKKLGLEGVIAKRLGSTYTPGKRTKEWLKIKAVKRQDCVIVGWLPGQGSRGSTIGSLALAVYRGKKLTYAGNCGTGFTEATLRKLKERFAQLVIKQSPLDYTPKEPELKHVTWIRPELVCEVEYLEFTSQHRLRAPSFKGIREDKAPEDALAEG
ncbi:MAG: non-homologous end-joining DNA ligase [Actinomycetota bacterium]|nr:non-homologous end-joining DNA ligase [Actinomycetota bacterium]